MPKFNDYRHHSDKNDHPKDPKHEKNGKVALPVSRNRGGESSGNNRYHPYQRHEAEAKNYQNIAGHSNNWKYFTFGRLLKLGTMNSDECVAEIAGQKTQFDQLLNDSFRPDLMVVTVQVLANVCRANFNQIITSVLSHACSATFLKSLQRYLTDLPFESHKDKWRNELYWEYRNGFWDNLVEIFNKMTILLPSNARDELVTILGKTTSTIKTIEKKQSYEIKRSVKDTILKIHNKLKEEIVKSEAGNKVRKTSSKEVKAGDPFEDFRTLSVIPTIDDLTDNHPFIRPSIIEGAYDSVEHYLDIQFRLLREDFLSPLSDGIKEYLYGPKEYRNSQLRVYRNVTLLSLEEAGNNLGLIVSFGVLKNVDWKDSKRFLFGGLLCLSSNNFDSILFATVADRDEDLLQKGRVLIKPCNNTVITQDYYHSDWVMLESKIYFEPYLAVLNAMRQMNDENFPMKKYLIDADISISLPRYLRPEENRDESQSEREYEEDDHYENDDSHENDGSYENDDTHEDDDNRVDDASYDDGDSHEDDDNRGDDASYENDYSHEDDGTCGDSYEDEDDNNYYYAYDDDYYSSEDGYDGYEDEYEDGEQCSENEDEYEDEEECSEEEDDNDQNGYRDEEEDGYKDAVLSYKGFSLPMGKDKVWPTHKELKLDATQYDAFKSALSQEFAIIQGPPGTGKTFIALEIIRTLLENQSYWRHDGPIVVVCLTNHALDQFLEGILKHTRSIVRVGSRSKSRVLLRYTLAERRRTLPWADKHHRSCAHKVARRKKYDARQVVRLMDKTRLALQYLTTKDVVVPLSLLSAYCDDFKLREFKNDDALLELLLENNQDHGIPGKKDNDGAIIIEKDEEKDEKRSINNDSKSFGYEKPIYLLEVIDGRIQDIQKKIEEYTIPEKKPKYERNVPEYNSVDQLERDVIELKKQRCSVQINLSQHPLLTPKQDISSPNLHWQNYWKWVKISHNNAVGELAELERDYRQATVELNEALEMVDLEVLRKYDVVGFTTTSAAKLHSSLRALNAPIVLVEEAAEILESHVICSLTKGCQHVILIGDHKQLRPKAAVYELGTKYNLNISLFERMVNIRGGTCTQLAHQHRMRPEIARLIRPSIYKTLHNHKSVLDYPSVMGLEKNMFFLNHKHSEESQDNQDTWMNPFEARFLVAFARYLILQGYKSTEITILCTYTGQHVALVKERKNYLILKNVRISTVDNYQGEENRIILLSLVRNNEEGNIGFLKEENRVCVALSRAREGLYILGNMDNLTRNNNVWSKIKEALESSKAIGDSLKLCCQFHPNKLISVQNASDFDQCPEGGCLLECKVDLPCGHQCTSFCHALDREHLNFTCRKPCVKNCPEDHPCPLLCYQGCVPCRVPVDRQLKCGHTVNVPCGADPETYLCPVIEDAISPHCKHAVEKACHESLDEYCCSQPCGIRLPCGHSCDQNCHVREGPDHLEYVCHEPCLKSNSDCTMEHPCKLQCHEKCKPCTVVVSKKLSCGHEHNLKCFGKVEEIQCYKRILLERNCGHKGTVRCYRKDEKCEDLTTKMSLCGHKVLVKCYQTPTSSHCHGKCERNLQCGHPCTARCKDSCITECEAPVPLTIPGLCGHFMSVPCHLKETEADSPTLLQYCKEPCKDELACGHICIGNCGSCKQGRIHKPCGKKCTNIFVCGHGCDVPCKQECPPCQKPCQIKCKHSRCNKKCGEPCYPCMEPCEAGCRHTRCMNWCSELCDIEPCEKPCFTLLKCGHQCIGFCGEPCPKLCRICDKKELIEEFFLGHENKPDARFVFLEDCGHCIESRGLLKWVSESNESIQVKTCPRCKTPISNCMRIGNQIKTDFKDIQLVKSKIFGDKKKLQNLQAQLVMRIKDMRESPVAQVFKDMRQIVENLGSSVALVTNEIRHQTLNPRATEAALIVLDILGHISNKYEKIKSHNVKSYTYVEGQITLLLESLPTRGQISDQEIKDIERELQRFHYMTKVCIMESEAGLDHSGNPEDHKPYDSVMETLVCIRKFSVTVEEEIVKDLEALQASRHGKIVVKNERKMIVKAMGYKRGQWYKCSNGHIYSIGERGRAMDRNKCNECGATIGGYSHRLINNNSVAT